MNRQKREVFDPSTLNDPVAQETLWSELNGKTPTRTNFHSYKLVDTGMERMHFQNTFGQHAFYVVFFLFGVVSVAAGVFQYLAKGVGLSSIMPLLFGLAFVGSTVFFLKDGAHLPVFDKTRGWFWKDTEEPQMAPVPKEEQNFAYLEEVHALQLLDIEDSDSGEHYQLNLVLKDGARIHIFTQGKSNEVLKDCNTLASFLERPLWMAFLYQ